MSSLKSNLNSVDKPIVASKKSGKVNAGAKRTSNAGQSTATSKTTFQIGNNVDIEVTRTDPEEVRNALYKTKCHKIERKIKEMVFLNTALDSELKDYKMKISEVSEERKCLLGTLLGHQKEVHGADATSKILQQALSKKSVKNERNSTNSNSSQFSSPSGPPATKRRKTSEMNNSLQSSSTGHRLAKNLDPAPKGLSQLLFDCNSGASSSPFLTDHPASA